ncbi:MAG: 50S ribosomal protein L25 [Actinobacteria bacterium]|nr:50S ribosomal protein L25 [Actinomycetota bacterium]
MTHVVKLTATPREVTGKSSHKLAGEGLVPAVVYGPKIETMSLSVDRREFEHMMHHASVGSTLIDLTVEGHGRPLDVIIREVRHDEVKGTVQHIDFWAVDMGHALQTAVPITFVGSPEGERAGGIVMHAMRELKVEARPKDLPEHIEVDLSALNIGDAFVVAQVTAPAGVTLLEDPEAVIASVQAPAVEEEVVVEAEEAAEVPEVGKETEEANEE